ncbi:hypothetical protein QVD17_37580 [Tagetes erecta]|uniref:HAT C-terminal dimerisation domain-containing protein n=1 Tax=Tagetes erecta TaxID=13708 RepID=A0AAD8JWY8_TARER|nr:hypothetical protein QVD17_37580 [Tagetes erecta]
MASQETQGSSSSSVEDPPLWNYVTKLEKQGPTGGTWKFKCNFCGETKQGSYSRVRAHLLATMEPKNWWVNFGAQTPFLQTMALRLLGQPSSSSCAERNWSTYAFIHSLRRNKLTTSRAEDLVYIHNNLRLLSRNPNEAVKMWDVGGDAFDSMEDVGFLEVADLMLDEPEFENDIITDN